MALFGQKDTFKVDSIVNNHLRKLLETPVAPKPQQEEAPAPEAFFASAVEPSTQAPAASDAAVVSFVAAAEPVAEPLPEVVVESLVEETPRVAIYVIEEPAIVEPAPQQTMEPLIEAPAVVCTEPSEPEVVEPVFTAVAEPIMVPVIETAAVVIESKIETVPAVSEVASSLANDLARCLAGAFQNLQYHIANENQKFNSSLQQQIERLQTSVEQVAQLRQPVTELASAISEQHNANAANLKQAEQLSTAVVAIQESQNRNNTELVTLRLEQLEMRAAVSAHGDELAILKGTASETARRVALMNDVMDRQNNVLRHLHEVETRRAAALQRAFESLDRTAHEPVRLAIPA